jgi:hypothetical protein
VKNGDQFLAQLLIPINLNKLKREDELNIYDAYSADLHFSLSGIIKYDCIQWELNVREYAAMPRLIIFPVTLWRVNMSLHVSKR